MTYSPVLLVIEDEYKAASQAFWMLDERGGRRRFGVSEGEARVKDGDIARESITCLSEVEVKAERYLVAGQPLVPAEGVGNLAWRGRKW